MSADLRKQLDEMAARWRKELAGRMAAEARTAEVTKAFKTLVKRLRDECDELLSKDAP